MVPRLILLGLGNPGRRYRDTRHNLGFMALDVFAARHGAEPEGETRTFVRAGCLVQSTDIILIKPKTYMNRSGRAVAELLRGTAFDPSELVVLADDMVLPLGQLRLRRRGSHGGHNGLRSVIDVLRTADFPRLRMGVGPVPDDVDPSDYVLERFPEAEQDAARALIGRAADCLDDLIAEGFDAAMSRHNKAERESD
jgi:PTH1 family peptidyl-tRNA hydrolase